MIPMEYGIFAAVIAFLIFVNWKLGRLLVGRVVRNMPAAQLNQGSYRAGAMVGILERLLIFFLVLVGEWGVIGFVIAAKSIARFKELEDKSYTDYYLTGTMTSILIAALTGYIATWARHQLLTPPS